MPVMIVVRYCLLKVEFEEETLMRMYFAFIPLIEPSFLSVEPLKTKSGARRPSVHLSFVLILLPFLSMKRDSCMLLLQSC
jgi:hypothetical protein